MLTKKLPVGIDSFEKLRREDFYYVDKTRMIVDLMANWGEVNLFTRPRRFGKTLNMSMLKCFFEIGTDKSLFDGLRVSEEKALCETYMGKYPVVFVSLKGVDGLTFEDAYRRLRGIIREEALRLSFLKYSEELDADDLRSFLRILSEEDTSADMVSSLRMLCSLLEKHYGQKPILLIDEYDAQDGPSMRANNSSAFNFRFVAGTGVLSSHSRGMAVDINPLYNPYVKTNGGRTVVDPAEAAPYADRTRDFPYKIAEDDPCCREFLRHGFTWGGHWKSLKDYQHFEKRR